jgi:parvulin-like peptidyl-prolyl isomerase
MSSGRRNLGRVLMGRGLMAVLGGTALVMAGCSGGDKGKDLTVADFAATQPTVGGAGATPGQVVTTRPGGGASGTATAPSDPTALIGPLRVVEAPLDDGSTPVNPKATPTRPTADGTIKSFKITDFTMDAMVGQVNGNPIYASTVLDKLKELETLGRNQPRLMFQQRAKILIESTLKQIIYDALILGVAERDLSDTERRGLEEVVKDHRARLIRQYGQGSLFLADEMAIAKEGKSIEQLMQDFRSIVLVNRYFKQKLLVKVHVTRKDIERYYLDHYDMFNQPASKRLRFIRTTFENLVKFEKALKSGKPFKDVASDSSNLSRPSVGGLFPDLVMGNEFAEALNQAIATLKQGKYAGPIRVQNNYWWVYCEEEIPGLSRPLREVQLEIEEQIRRERTRVLSEKYQTQLFQDGSYGKEAGYNRDRRTVESNNRALDEMVESLLAVAMARYAQPAMAE